MRKKSFLKRLNDYDGFFTLLALVVGVIVYSFTNFATVRYVNEQTEAIQSSLSEMKVTLKSIDSRVWQLRQQGVLDGNRLAIDPGEVD